jgi:HAMP domain-containing protein
LGKRGAKARMGQSPLGGVNDSHAMFAEDGETAAVRRAWQVLSDPTRRSLEVTDKSIIRHILILEEDGTVFDSSDKDEIGKRITSQTQDLPPLLRGDVRLSDQNRTSEGLWSMTTSIDTQKARRTIIVVISMDRLQSVKDSAASTRLATLGVMGALLILLIGWFSSRATRPISSLAEADRRVASGDLDFEVKPKRNDEIGALARTFNEMLADLRRKRELEEQLRRAEHSAVVGRLASGIAHEIRNPLNFINLSIDHLQASCARGSTRDEHTRILS